VQLEAGTTASPFEYRQYGTELALCQRYYLQLSGSGSGTQAAFASGLSTSTSQGVYAIIFPVAMRAAPSASQSNLLCTDGYTSDYAVTSIVQNNANTTSARIYFNSASGQTAGRGSLLSGSSSSASYLALAAEL
jgi:hypothetical protein